MNKVSKMRTYDGMRKNIILLVVTAGLMAVLFFFITMIVKSTTDFDRAELEGYYKPLETKLVEDARAYLEQQGYRNSGVMLTRVIEESGEREYKLTVHHAKLDALSEEMRREVAEGFEQFYFRDERTSFCCTFLINN